MTSYDLGEIVVTPKEAGAVEYEEPEWRERFEAHCVRWPRLPRYLQEDSAFEATLSDWRRFHWTPVKVDGKDKKLPAGMTEAVIALAKLGIMAPRSAWQEPRADDHGFQHDDHCWMSYASEQWRVTGIEDQVLHLEKMWFEDKQRETKQIDLSRARWDGYIESAVAVLDAMA